MLSRVADSIFWMNRYIERAENVARIVDVNLYLMLDMPHGSAAHWDAVLATTGDHDMYREHYGAATADNVIRFLTADATYPSSILSCLRAARDNARSVRDVISSEMWEAVNRAYLQVREAAASGKITEAPHELFTEVKLASHLFVGLTYLTMSHNEAWHFGQLARLIERADKTSRMVDVKYFILLPDPAEVGGADDEIQWAAVLKSASAFEMYRKRFGRITPANVMDFLLLDPQFPRSLRYCTRRAEDAVQAITGGGSSVESIVALREHLERASIAEIMAHGVHEYLDGFQTRLNSVGDDVQRRFFSRDGV